MKRGSDAFPLISSLFAFVVIIQTEIRIIQTSEFIIIQTEVTQCRFKNYFQITKGMTPLYK